MKTVLAVLLISSVGLAQATPEFTPPPMVPANPSAPPVAQPANPGTPPPPPPPGYMPGAQPNNGYPYSPYGTPMPLEKPKPEIGLMVSEALFGMLTSAGVTLIPYFLLFAPGRGGLQDDTINAVIFTLIFAAVPLAVAQTQISLANGSKYYAAEMWIPALVGLAAQAAVLGLYYATGWLPAASGCPPGATCAPTPHGSDVLLLVGSIAIVPLMQMAAINLFKSPKVQFNSAMSWDSKRGLALGLPAVSPMVAQTSQGASLGLNVPFFSAKF